MPNPNHNPWTEDDECLLAKTYEQWPVVLPPALLARHSRASCSKRAYENDITRRRLVGRAYKHVTKAQWSYFAGIIDGEGTIHSHVVRGTQTNRYLSFANTYRPLIDWALELFPGGQEYKQNVGLDRRVPCWNVKWTRAALIAELIDGMLPYMIVKRELAVAIREALPKGFKTRAS